MAFIYKSLLIRLCIITTTVCLLSFIALSFFTSLHQTIPANIPLFSSIPVYRNKWQYTPPTHLSQPNPQLTAAYITFIHEEDRQTLGDLRATMRSIEDMFNKNHSYPYIIFSTKDLSTEYKELISSMTQGDVKFEKISNNDFGYGNKTDQFRAFLSRKNLEGTADNTEEFRFKSRLMAGLLYNHEGLNGIDYFWRFEPGTEYPCPIDFDPFQYMKDNHKQFSFSIATYERQETIPSLFKSVIKFKKQHPEWAPTIDKPERSLLAAMLDDQGNYNRCYFWNNFQIAKTSFFRSPQYQAFFNFIDQEEGIFYERWSDPVIQSLAAALFLNRHQVHFWKEVGYHYKFSYLYCPTERSIWEKCSCRPENSFDKDGLSCLYRFE
ncbi:MAG: nucleotide-diphospho-sugar transferase [Benjaminiella poitrasii]|nr:MAG: nucleotide-diphospho-sugar transferase [Benjaminiella poitrasii]